MIARSAEGTDVVEATPWSSDGNRHFAEVFRFTRRDFGGNLQRTAVSWFQNPSEVVET